jgi:flavin reductase (DIM6/NTAB) family NADH-FMN oxidoreductase RutF
MDPQARKTVLRMIPYGLYVFTAEGPDGRVAAATVNWVTQASFEPPLVAVAVRQGSTAHEVVRSAGAFALNVLVKGQNALAFTFFKSLERDGDTIGGERFVRGRQGAPILDNAAGFVECALVELVERGDHALCIGEVVDAGVRRDLAGRPDDHTLWLRDLGEKTFYGG